jgi:hypothetical protein
MAYEFNIHYAEIEKGETLAVDGLWAGDTPSPSTIDVAVTVSGSPIPQFTPLQRHATTHAFELWAAGNEVAAVTAYEIPVGTSRAALYIAGCFNLDAINWPAATTEAQVQAAERGMIVFRKLLWSDKRTGTEPAPGTPAGPT